MPHVYGMNPTELQEQACINRLKAVYKEIPPTTCCSNITCCKAGCPNMYYAEYTNIRKNYIEPNWTKEEKLDLIVECLRMYLQEQSVEHPKPCPLLEPDGKCSVYDGRPYKCRRYGLIPKGMYDKLVSSVARDMKVDRTKIPLCSQCPNVKINAEKIGGFPDGVIPEKTILELEAALKENDLLMGMPKKIQQDGFGSLTFHDWHLMYTLGSWASAFTKFRTRSAEEKEKLLDIFKKTMLDSIIKETDKKE